MMETDLIILKEYCINSDIDPSFVLLLEDGGLIEIVVVEGIEYIESSQLRNLEMFSRLYYDLSINVEGIDAINHLLTRLSDLRREIIYLRSKLTLYESEENEFI